MHHAATQRMLLCALAFATVCIAPSGASAQDAGAELLKRASEDRAKGRDGAPVLVFEIADFQCPFCARFATEVYPKLDSAYIRTGKVQWVFVNLPLPNHPRAWIAAEAAACAGAVAGRFWQMHDRLFGAQREWGAAADPHALLARYAREAGVPAAAFAACVETDAVAPMLLQDLMFASASGVTGTPTFIINREEMLVGLKSYEEWQGIIEKALK